MVTKDMAKAPDTYSSLKHRYGKFFRAAKVVALGMSLSANLANGRDVQIWSEKPPIKQAVRDVQKKRITLAIKSRLKELTDRDSEFERIVLQADRPVIVEAWESWSRVSREFLQLIDQVSDKYSGRINFARMNYDNMSRVPSLQNYFGKLITAVPTTFFIYKGQILDKNVGSMGEVVLQNWLDKNMKRAESISGQ